jgi:hypothetical protein
MRGNIVAPRMEQVDECPKVRVPDGTGALRLATAMWAVSKGLIFSFDLPFLFASVVAGKPGPSFCPGELLGGSFSQVLCAISGR